MLAKLHDKPFDDPDWIYEIKWDGYRAIADIKKEEIKLYSRNGLSFKKKYPGVYEALRTIKKNVVLDGEIVALDKKGKPSFQLLQQYEQDNNIPLVYYIFDCLQVDGKSIEDQPLLKRKEILKKLLPENDWFKYCDHIEEKGKGFFALAKKQGLEGIIAKKADGKYHEGARSNEWLKLKNLQTEEAIIAGYTEPSGSRKYFGALVLGVYKNKKLTYIGHTGTGFDQKTLKDTYTKLQSLITPNSPFDTDVKVNNAVTWVKPVLVCNLKFTEVTSEGNRRHPVFMGLRIDKAANEVKQGADRKTTSSKSKSK